MSCGLLYIARFAPFELLRGLEIPTGSRECTPLAEDVSRLATGGADRRGAKGLEVTESVWRTEGHPRSRCA